MKVLFNQWLGKVLQHEGGNDDDPDDPGGRTSRGITAERWAEWRQTHPGLPADVWQAPQSEVVAIYKTKYWDVMRCDDLPAGVDYAVFDFGVNSGPRRAATFLQEIVGAAVDGEIGPQTLDAVRRMSAATIVTKLCDNRLAYLKGLSKWWKYGNGWGRRVAEVKSAALQAVVTAPVTSPTRAAPTRSIWSAIGDLLVALFGRKKPDAPVPVPATAEPVWLPGARADIGFHEVGVNRGIEKFIRDGHTGSLGDPYCAIWMNAKLENVGIPGTRSAMARSFENHPNFIRLPGPALGAICTMWRGSPSAGTGHCYFYLGETANGYIGLGANQDDGVNVRLQPKTRHTGFWWPRTLPVPKIGPIMTTIRAAESKTEV